MAHPSGNEVLMQSGLAPDSAEWPAVGSRVVGKIVGTPRSFHAREYAKDGQGPLKYFPSGDPVLGVMIDLQTQERRDAEDGGIRRIYADKPRMLGAIKAAVLAAGKTGLESDAWLEIVWTGEEESQQGGNPAKTYSARYQPPQVSVPGPRSDPPAQHGTVAATPPPALTTQAAPTATTQAVPGQGFPEPATPVPPAAAPAGKPQITATVAAAMANAGIDISSFDIIPG